MEYSMLEKAWNVLWHLEKAALGTPVWKVDLV